MTYEDYLAINIPISKNFELIEKEVREFNNESEGGFDYLLVEENVNYRIRNSKKYCIIAILLLVLAALIVVGIYFIVSME